MRPSNAGARGCATAALPARTHFNKTTFRLLVPALILVICACCRPESCCLQFDPDTDEATYCGNHRTAVMMWVQSVDEATERRARLDVFKEFYETVKRCESTACIEESVTQAQNMPSFKEEYLEANAASEESTDLAEGDKDDLILCGFRHAIEALEENLKREE